MHTYILTRFSIFDPKYKHFNLTDLTHYNRHGYKSKLFSSRRLDFKFKVFEKMTLPTVIHQTHKDYTWYIYTSNILPEKYKKKLLKLTEKHPQIKCKFIESFKEFTFTPDKEGPYCTVRLDDDDGLNPHFFKNLQKYKHLDGCIISHSHGLKYRLKEGNVDLGSAIVYKNIALGLCAIGKNIYDCGAHTEIAENHKVIYDETPKMYYLCYSELCDSKRVNFS